MDTEVGQPMARAMMPLPTLTEGAARPKSRDRSQSRARVLP
jgi:hypothetical protein